MITPQEVLPAELTTNKAIYVDLNPAFDAQTSPSILVVDEYAIILGSLYNLFLCPVGGRSRIFQEDYHSGIYNLLQEPLDDTTAVGLNLAIRQAIQKWEPRIRVTSIQVAVAQELPGYEVLVSGIMVGVEKPFSASFNLNKR